jgi:hypothetical protein
MKLKELRWIFFAGMLGFTGNVHADGPPIDADGVTVEHVSLKITDEQSRLAGIYRYIELSDDQLKLLDKGITGNRPRMLQIITYPHNDCTCGMPFYGLWTSRNEVQIPSLLLTVTEEDLANEGTPPDKLADGCDDWCVPYYRDMQSRKEYMPADTLSLDYDGDLYHQGEKIENLGNVLKMIETRFEYNGEAKSIWIYTPPLWNVALIRKRLLEISNYFAANGYEARYYARGFFSE